VLLIAIFFGAQHRRKVDYGEALHLELHVWGSRLKVLAKMGCQSTFNGTRTAAAAALAKH
jgi:hypothetical protein